MGIDPSKEVDHFERRITRTKEGERLIEVTEEPEEASEEDEDAETP